jgi:hypothetical protein
MIFRIVLTIIFGIAWWWCFNHVGASGLTYLMILGSVLAVCACCCQGQPRGEWAPGDFNYQQWLACIRRCWMATVTLMIGLVFIAAIVVLINHGTFTATLVADIFIAAIGPPLFVRLICCAYES